MLAQPPEMELREAEGPWGPPQLPNEQCGLEVADGERHRQPLWRPAEGRTFESLLSLRCTQPLGGMAKTLLGTLTGSTDATLESEAKTVHTPRPGYYVRTRRPAVKEADGETHPLETWHWRRAPQRPGTAG